MPHFQGRHREYLENVTRNGALLYVKRSYRLCAVYK